MACKLNICLYAPLIILVSGISVDSTPAMQALWSKGIVRQSLINSYNVCAGHYQCYDEFIGCSNNNNNNEFYYN